MAKKRVRKDCRHFFPSSTTKKQSIGKKRHRNPPFRPRENGRRREDVARCLHTAVRKHQRNPREGALCVGGVERGARERESPKQKNRTPKKKTLNLLTTTCSAPSFSLSKNSTSKKNPKQKSARPPRRGPGHGRADQQPLAGKEKEKKKRERSRVLFFSGLFKRE